MITKDTWIKLGINENDDQICNSRTDLGSHRLDIRL